MSKNTKQTSSRIGRLASECAETAKVHPDLRIVYNLAYGVLAGEAGRFSLVGDYTTRYKSKVVQERPESPVNTRLLAFFTSIVVPQRGIAIRGQLGPESGPTRSHSQGVGPVFLTPLFGPFLMILGRLNGREFSMNRFGEFAAGHGKLSGCRSSAPYGTKIGQAVGFDVRAHLVRDKDHRDGFLHRGFFR